MWGTLQKEFEVSNYWGVDFKPKKGRLKIDSVRILQQGISEDVIDVDTYGAPWKHWLAILQNITKETTVFLTIGQNKMVGGFQGQPPKEITLALSLPPSTPPSISANLWAIGSDIMLAKAGQSATIIEAVEAVSTGNARYIGVRLEPINKNSLPTVDAASKPKHRKAIRSNANV